MHNLIGLKIYVFWWLLVIITFKFYLTQSDFTTARQMVHCLKFEGNIHTKIFAFYKDFKLLLFCFTFYLFIQHVFHSSLTTFTKHFVLLRIHKHASIEDTCLTFSRLLCLCETYNFLNWNLIFLSFCVKLNHYSFHLWCWFSKPQFKFTILIEYTICNMQTVLYSFFFYFFFFFFFFFLLFYFYVG